MILDTTGATIPEADVQLEGPVKASGKTLGDGSIRLTLPYGEYTVAIAKPGFERAKRSQVIADSSKSLTLSVVLQAGYYCNDCCDECVPAIQPTTSDLSITLDDRPKEQILLSSGPMIHSLALGSWKSFNPCSTEKPCVKIYKFDTAPNEEGCCTLIVRNGDGQGNDEVKDYKIIVNGKVFIDNPEKSQVDVHLRKHNTVKAILTGEPSSNLLVMFAYKPRKAM